MAVVPDGGSLRVPKALHIRRGDLTKSHARATADEYYYRVVERIRAVLPDADVHAWSSTKNILAFKQSLWSQENFRGYTERSSGPQKQDGWMDGWTDGWMDGWMDGRMHGWMDGWMD